MGNEIDNLLKYRYKVLSSKSDIFGDVIAIFDIFNKKRSDHWIGIKYFGLGKRFTKWTAQVWTVESDTNKETQIIGTFEKSATVSATSSDESGVCIGSLALLNSSIFNSSILRIEITITEWNKTGTVL